MGKESISNLAALPVPGERSSPCRHEGAEPKIGVPLVRQKRRDPGMPGWKALEHILSILIHESTQAATLMRFRGSERTQG